LFGINFEATSKNREIGEVLALGGRRSINTYNNPMEVGVWGGGYIEEEARPGKNVQGGARSLRFCCQTERQKQRKIKLHLGLRRPPFKILGHNNQPKACVRAQ
jgi:hypothetical protein